MHVFMSYLLTNIYQLLPCILFFGMPTDHKKK